MLDPLVAGWRVGVSLATQDHATSQLAVHPLAGAQAKDLRTVCTKIARSEKCKRDSGKITSQKEM